MQSDWPFGLLARGGYRVILADPPWAFRGYVDKGVPQRAPAQHYGTLTASAMARLPVGDLAMMDTALCLWSTSSHTEQAFWLARQWGFRFASKLFTWAKLNRKAAEAGAKVNPMDADPWFMGMGHGTRRNTEDCWLFVRGTPRRRDKGVRELIVSPVREHSRKPDEAYQRIERLFAGPYCELFSRTSRLGWDAWGNEKGKFDG